MSELNYTFNSKIYPFDKEKIKFKDIIKRMNTDLVFLLDLYESYPDELIGPNSIKLNKARDHIISIYDLPNNFDIDKKGYIYYGEGFVYVPLEKVNFVYLNDIASERIYRQEKNYVVMSEDIILNTKQLYITFLIDGYQVFVNKNKTIIRAQKNDLDFSDLFSGEVYTSDLNSITYNKNLVDYKEPKNKIYFYYMDINRKYKNFTNEYGFNMLNELQYKVDIMTSNLDKSLLAEGKDIYTKKISKEHESATWNKDEYKNEGFRYYYLNLKSKQRFTEMYSLFERINHKELFDPNDRIVSVGGGPGFELYALSKLGYKNLISLDLEEKWKSNNDILGIQFHTYDLYKDRVDKYNPDIIILSYVFSNYMNDENGLEMILDWLKKSKCVIINDRKKYLELFDGLSNVYRAVNYDDDRQLVIFNENKLVRPNNNLTYPNVPYELETKFGILEHAHYSGYVFYSTILKYIRENKNEFYLEYNDMNVYELHYINQGKFNYSNITDKNIDEVERYIIKIWKENIELMKLGVVFYNVIKNKNFIPIYCNMILNQMKGIEYAYFRIGLGKHFYYKNNKKIYLSYSEEISLLKKHSNKKFSLIIQGSKLKSPYDIELYYNDIKKFIDGKFIVAFDLVGGEEKQKANLLKDYLFLNKNICPHCIQSKYYYGSKIIKNYGQKNRLLHDYDPQLKYKEESKNRSVIHWGQRKLLLSEIEFLLNYGEGIKYVVYPGSAPGHHIPYLSELFPDKIFLLVDPNNFYIKESENIKINYKSDDGMFNSNLAKIYKDEFGQTLLISDIRSASLKTMSKEEFEKQVEFDMNLQKEWVEIMKPKFSILKFRLHYIYKDEDIKDFLYLDGDIYLPIWGPVKTTECRLITDGKSYKKYNTLEHESKMYYFNTVTRSNQYPHILSKSIKAKNFGYDNCYDCRSEIFIISNYLKSIGKIVNEKNILDMAKRFDKESSSKFFDRKLKDGNIIQKFTPEKLTKIEQIYLKK